MEVISYENVQMSRLRQNVNVNVLRRLRQNYSLTVCDIRSVSWVPGMAEGTDATNILLEKISRAEERNNELLSAVQKNTKVVAVISIISMVAAVASALFTVLSLISFM